MGYCRLYLMHWASAAQTPSVKRLGSREAIRFSGLRREG
jgi:hypothetical protein